MRYLIATIAASLATLVSGTVIAISMQQIIAPYFVGHIRTEEQGLLFPSLIAGYFVIGAVLTYLATRLEAAQTNWISTLITGTIIGLAIFLGDHLVTAGWSLLNAPAMAFSGLLDSLSVAAGFCAARYVLIRANKPPQTMQT